MALDYLNFDLRLDDHPLGGYTVAVVNSPAGETSGTFDLQFPDLENLLLRLENAVIKGSQRGGARRRLYSPEEKTVQDFGHQLFQTLFPADIRSLYDQSRILAQNESKGLRLRLRINSPKLSAMPWEFLYDPRGAGRYLSLFNDTPLIRYLETPYPVTPLTIPAGEPLRILGMIAAPTDQEALDVDGERAHIEDALSDVSNVALTWVSGGTVRALTNALDAGQWHIFHFIGHGLLNTRTKEGMIALCNTQGKTHPFSASQLATLLADHQPLRFAYLNSCEGAKSDSADLYSSTASILVGSGLAAVLAMQYEIFDEGAKCFAKRFYEALANGDPVDQAATKGRKAIRSEAGSIMEWGTPVLTMRSPDGVLFTVRPAQKPAPSPLAGRDEDPVALFNEASACVEGERYSEATALYERLLGWAPPFRERQVRALLKQAEELLAEQEKARAAQKRLEEAEERFSDLETFVQLARTESAKAHAREEIQQFLADYPEYKTDANVLALWERVKPPPPPKPPEPALGTRMTDEKGVIMVYVPPGTFQMGSSNDADERPIHSVTIERGFWLDLTPVTNASYAQFIKDGGYKTETYWTPGGWAWRKTADKTAPRDYDDFTAPQQPRVGVTWFEAYAYCQWREGRLPTEAEWEWAARGERRLVYPWGNDFKRDSSVVIYGENSGRKSHPVGEGIRVAGASWVGALDMSGNVWEWISSLYTPYPYDGNDGREADTGDRTDVLRVLRGGSWGDSQDNVRAANRFRVDPANQFNRWGFRLARSYR